MQQSQVCSTESSSHNEVTASSFQLLKHEIATITRYSDSLYRKTILLLFGQFTTLIFMLWRFC